MPSGFIKRMALRASSMAALLPTFSTSFPAATSRTNSRYFHFLARFWKVPIWPRLIFLLKKRRQSSINTERAALQRESLRYNSSSGPSNSEEEVENSTVGRFLNSQWEMGPRRLSENGYFPQSLRQAQISILKILNVFLRLKSSPSLTLQKMSHSRTAS